MIDSPEIQVDGGKKKKIKSNSSLVFRRVYITLFFLLLFFWVNQDNNIKQSLYNLLLTCLEDYSKLCVMVSKECTSSVSKSHSILLQKKSPSQSMLHYSIGYMCLLIFSILNSSMSL